MNFNKIIMASLMVASCFILILSIFGVFLCSVCLSSEKEDAKIYDLISKKKYAQAITTLNNLVSKTKDEQTKSKYQYITATCYRMNEQWDRAISLYKSVADQKESRFAEIARLRIAKYYQKQSNYPSAISEYEKILSEHPKSPSAIEAQYQIAECYSVLKDYDKAIENYKKFMDTYTQGNRPKICAYRIGVLYQEAQKYQDAYNQYQKILRQYPDSSVAKQAVDKIKTIISSYTQINVNRDDYYYMGLALYNAKLYKECRDELKKAINDKDDISQKSAYLIAQSYQDNGEYDTAQKEYDSFIKLYPESKDTIEAKYKISQCVLKSGKIDDAIQLMAKFALDYPKSEFADDAEFQIAKLYKEKDQISKAIEVFNNVFEKYPDSDSADDALWNIGWCYMNLKMNDKSAQAFQRLITQYPNSQLSSSARFWAGASYEKMGNYPEAVNAYKQAMANRDWYYSDRAKKRIDLLVKDEKIDKEISLYQYKKAEYEDFLPITTTIREFTPLWVNEAINLGIIDDVMFIFQALEESGIALEATYYNLSICYEKMGEYRTSWAYLWRLTRLPNVKSKNGLLPKQFYLKLYPSIFSDIVYNNAKANNVDPHLVSAVILEESKYDYKAISRSDARGLMQIMPSTGKDIAKQLKISKFNTDELFEPETNIKMGSWYLAKLINSFSEKTRQYFDSKGITKPDIVYDDIAMILALGGYNAGPTRMRNWIEEYGIDDIEAFVENIPMQEPRNYIKKVLNSYEMYKSLYGS